MILPFQTFLTFPCDAHWNARGHEVAARAIWQFLRAQKLFSRS